MMMTSGLSASRIVTSPLSIDEPVIIVDVRMSESFTDPTPVQSPGIESQLGEEPGLEPLPSKLDSRQPPLLPPSEPKSGNPWTEIEGLERPERVSSPRFVRPLSRQSTEEETITDPKLIDLIESKVAMESNTMAGSFSIEPHTLGADVDVVPSTMTKSCPNPFHNHSVSPPPLPSSFNPIDHQHLHQQQLTAISHRKIISPISSPIKKSLINHSSKLISNSSSISSQKQHKFNVVQSFPSSRSSSCAYDSPLSVSSSPPCRWPLSCMTNILSSSTSSQMSMCSPGGQLLNYQQMVMSSSPSWTLLPQSVLELVFTYVNLRDLKNVAAACKRWNGILMNDESSEVWKYHCIKKLSKAVLKSDVLCNVPSYKGKLRAYFYAWNPNQCSRNIFIKPNGFTLHRNPVAQSTDGAKGKIGLIHGRHCWEVWWEGPLGTVAVIGVSTIDAPVQAPGYVALLGSNSDSWGWNLVDNHLLHNGDCHGNFPLQNNAPKYQTGERLRVILDADDHTLSFERNYEFLGVAFRGLPKKPLYPTVSAVYGNTEVSMVYLGYPLDG